MEFFWVDTGFMGKRDLVAIVIPDLCNGIVLSKHPLLEFFICSPDRLPIDIAVSLVVVPLIVTIDKIDVIGGVEPPVGNNDRAGVRKIFFYPVQDRTHVDFF